MLRKRFSTALLALLVVTAMSGSAFAADASSDSTGQADAPAVLLTTEVPPTVETPAVEPPAVEPPAVEPPAVEPPAVEPPAVEPPAVEPPAVEPPAVEPPAVEPPAVEPPAVELEVVPEVLPVEEAIVTEPAILVDELVTEPAIIVEPVAATLTITHRLIVGDKYDDLVQTFEGLAIGQTINLADYIMETENVVCISSPSEMAIDEENDTVVLEYNFIEIRNYSDGVR